MIDVLGFIAFLVLPLVGLGVWRLEPVRRLALDGRLAVAGATGALMMAVVMSLMSAIGLQWTRTRLFIGFIILACVSVAMAFRGRPPLERRHRRTSGVAILALAIFGALAVYGTLSARQTSGDLSFFWAPKGIKFFRAGGIDVEFLRDPNYFFMHSDYPPLLPLIYAWSNTVSRQFAWWAAVMSGALCVFGCVVMIRAFSGDDHASVLAASALTYAHAVSYSAGGADPPLLLFEALTLVALTFVDDPRTQSVLTALGLAGAVWTKVEGTSFAIAVLVAMIALRREIVRPVIVATPAALLLGGWLFFVWRHGLLDTFRNTRERLHFELLPKILATTVDEASYGAAWLPWIALLAAIALGADWRRAALPLVVSVLTFGVTIFFFLHSSDPAPLIASAAKRILQTPMLALAVAAAATSRTRSRSVDAEI